MDFHVLQVLLQRSWNIVSGAATVAIIPFWMTGSEQGYYYTFISLLALQIFFELGFNVVIVQLIGHEAAGLTMGPRGAITGNAGNVARVQSLVVLLKRWYLIAALLFWVAVSIGGIWFFSSQGNLATSEWIGVWLALCTFTAVNLYLSPQLAVLEGMGCIGQVARVRRLQSICGSVLMWLALISGAGLYALPLLTLTTASLSLWWLRSYRALLNAHQSAGTHQNAFKWRQDIFPLQWRIAVSWMSGYFIFYAFTPLLFAHQGPVEAGRVGLALSIFSSLSTLGMSWITANAPTMMQHVARGERQQLNQLFVGISRNSIGFTTSTSLVLLGAISALAVWRPELAYRFASIPVLICLAIVAAANSFIFAAATYMRAHKVEPLLVPSVVGAVLTFAAAWVGSQRSTTTMMVLYAALTLSVGLPWTVKLFLPFFRRTA